MIFSILLVKSSIYIYTRQKNQQSVRHMDLFCLTVSKKRNIFKNTQLKHAAQRECASVCTRVCECMHAYTFVCVCVCLCVCVFCRCGRELGVC